MLRNARKALVLLALVLCWPGAAAQAQAPGLLTPCGGRAIVPDEVVTGQFGTELSKTFVMVPFEVPRGTTAVRVKYCWDRPESGSSRHTLDLGLYEPRRGSSGLWGMDEFRGWGGSSHPDVTVSAEGYSTEAEYSASPRIDPPGKTTRAFVPGPIKPGLWAAELGVAAVIPASEGDADGTVKWRVEIDFASDPAFADEPYRPARYDKRPARRGPGWYAGDFHVHAEHSALGDATMTETFDYAFGSLADGKAGLDFITLSDYVSGTAWGEIGHYQPLHPRNLVVRSAEVITYRGHTNNHASARIVDYREGIIYERLGDGSLRRLRGDRDPRSIFSEVHHAGGFTQINHPTIFPPVSPGLAALCRGCFWEYSDAETDYSRVDAYEIATGPSQIGDSPNPFTLTAIESYERLLGAGYRIAAVGSSDSHDAGSGSGPLDAPIGEATTVVYAPRLSEQGIRCGIEGRHTYVKVTGNAGPDVRFTARPWGGRQTAIVGDTVRARGASFSVRIRGAAGRALVVFKDGRGVALVPITSDHFTHRFEAAGPGRWRVQIVRGALIDTVSSPIWLEPGRGTVKRDGC